METVHVPVLLQEVLDGLGLGHLNSKNQEPYKDQAPRQNVSPIYLDGTLGGAGHALAIAKALNGKLEIIGLDRDQTAIDRAARVLQGKAERVILECHSFRDLDETLERNSIAGVDMILLDLGISSDELEHSGRGFTFQKDEPLLMTMGDPALYAFTAYDIVNGWKEEDIANVIFAYGEERYAKRIARALIGYRTKKKVETSCELAEVVKSAVPRARVPAKIHPATKTFQGLRIAVNDELQALREGLAKGYESLNDGGRMAVISFHSLEDRIVKDFFRSKAVKDEATVSKKPITASAQEIAENPRSRSAKLRVLNKNIRTEA